MVNGVAQSFFPELERQYVMAVPPNLTKLSETTLEQIRSLALDNDDYLSKVFKEKATILAKVIKPMGIYSRVDQNDIAPFAEENKYLVNITNDELKKLKLSPGYTIVPHLSDIDNSLYPYYGSDTLNKWSIDNYGPITIPAKGMTIPLTADNLIRYLRCIEVYEGNKVENSAGKISINGAPATSYTFKMNYYWMMGDNRHNSLDSRYWGFVPEDHVVGKASLIWFSWEHGPRWKRLFNSIK
jgi:signal peptidase I